MGDGAGRDQPDRVRATLRIMETTDLHMHLMPHDYFTDRPTPATGFALTASLIRALRKEVPNALLFDNGDFLQGNPMSDWAAGQGPDATNPAIVVMNAMGYDAATLGNHEFNYGVTYLRHAISMADFPVLSANVVSARGQTPQQDARFVPPWTILNREVAADDGATHRIAVGVIGFAPPQITDWERLSIGTAVETRDIVETARAYVGEMRAAGADIIVALSHSGIGADANTVGMENASVPLAAVPGIDAVLAGHTHRVFPGEGHAATGAVDPVAGTLHGKPAVMAGAFGSHLGVIDLTLEADPAGWRVVNHLSRALPVATQTTPEGGAQAVVSVDPEVNALLAAPHEAVLTAVRAPIARTAVPLSTHFAFAAPSAALTVVADLVRDHVRRVVAPEVLGTLPLLAAVAPFKAGGAAGAANFMSIPAGPLAVRHASELYPFPNGLCLLRLTGADVMAWLEVSARAFARITPGERHQPLRNLSVPPYNFDVIHGLRYTVDIGVAPGARISGLRFADGATVAAEKQVLLVTNGYRAGGGGNFGAARNGALVYSERRPLREVLIDGLQRAQDIAPVAEPVWRFARVAGASAWFDAGTEAPEFATGGDFDPLGPSDAGFQRYRIDFDALPEA